MIEPRVVNIPLLRKAIEWAEIEACKPRAESQWEQNTYRLEAGEAIYSTEIEDDVIKCNTAYCIAGWVVAMTLGENEYQETTGDVYSVNGRKFVDEVEARAKKELGISNDLGLFECYNTIEDVRRIAEDIAGERL